MGNFKFIGTPLSRTEMRNVSGGTPPELGDGYGPCTEDTCQSDADCGTACNRPGVKSYCATTVCQDSGQPTSSYKSCDC
ncbi:hypothetical protein [Flavobacterium terrisoli]|uniref:hypothetical protein n=1 Tax=Flavobacterium terrisoli TaxID=3242195 RepID=UPI002542B81F|nr:hypothetical protein [Flavobacterium buctense]